jgi:peptidoglycan/LPS O-acetylase OafA/YrhL
MSPARLDLPRIGIATVVAGTLGVGLAVAFLHHAQSTRDVGPTSATLDDAFSSLLGAVIGLAVGGVLGALSVRRGSRVLSGLMAGLFAYVFVLIPVFVSTDDVSLDEDLSLGGLIFLAFLAVPLGASAFAGATAGDSFARRLGRRRGRAADK